ncbi:YciI family protein [Amycolatopsis taiwanensis]|uniref:YciI family protein n=1 Tax=Amycolatopsis taiwanensis TaxID=342230 RepID=UPI00048927D5|nr:YciI family protein [Amycolatopsis taiwanensis]
MKYMIMLPLTQKDVDAMAKWSPQDLAALHGFMAKWNNDLVESGEFVDAHGLTAPVHTRRVSLKDGVPVVTDGPYAETQEVLGGYTIVDCAGFDRATEIAAKLVNTPHPADASLVHDWHVDIRPIAEQAAESLE